MDDTGYGCLATHIHAHADMQTERHTPHTHIHADMQTERHTTYTHTRKRELDHDSYILSRNLLRSLFINLTQDLRLLRKPSKIMIRVSEATIENVL